MIISKVLCIFFVCVSFFCHLIQNVKLPPSRVWHFVWIICRQKNRRQWIHTWKAWRVFKSFKISPAVYVCYSLLERKKEQKTNQNHCDVNRLSVDSAIHWASFSALISAQFLWRIRYIRVKSCIDSFSKLYMLTSVLIISLLTISMNDIHFHNSDGNCRIFLEINFCFNLTFFCRK